MYIYIFVYQAVIYFSQASVYFLLKTEKKNLLWFLLSEVFGQIDETDPPPDS